MFENGRLPLCRWPGLRCDDKASSYGSYASFLYGSSRRVGTSEEKLLDGRDVGCVCERERERVECVGVPKGKAKTRKTGSWGP
jgi:hypothetical protein